MIDGIVLDVELAQAETISQPRAAHERRITGVQAGLRFTGDGQQLTISPEILGTVRDQLAREVYGGVVVNRFERPQAFRADIGRFSGKYRLTQMTLQSDKRAHTASANECSDNPLISRGSTSTGAGTMAARSRAIATRSLMIATAGASPPAP